MKFVWIWIFYFILFEKMHTRMHEIWFFCLMYLWIHEHFSWIWKCMFEYINLIFCYFYEWCMEFFIEFESLVWMQMHVWMRLNVNVNVNFGLYSFWKCICKCMKLCSNVTFLFLFFFLIIHIWIELWFFLFYFE